MSFDETGTAVYPLFSDITVGNRIITVAEQNSAHLYQYDSEGICWRSLAGRERWPGSLT